MRRLLTLALLLIVLLPAASASATPRPLPDVQTIEAYLNGISTLRSRFVQTANDGKQVTGTFMLKRPGKMRFDYDPPVKDFIVADGLLIYYYDGQMKQQSSIPISKSLADFFLRKEMRLSGDITLFDIQRVNDQLNVVLTQTKNPMAGTLTLIFSEEPLQLRKWRIVDAQAQTTEVELYDSQTGVALSNELFKYYDPERRKSNTNK